MKLDFRVCYLVCLYAGAMAGEWRSARMLQECAGNDAVFVLPNDRRFFIFIRGRLHDVTYST